MKIFVMVSGLLVEAECFRLEQGLAITRSPVYGDFFRIIHIHSGRQIEGWLFAQVAHASAAFDLLLGRLDWELSEDALRADLRQNPEKACALKVLFREIGELLLDGGAGDAD